MLLVSQVLDLLIAQITRERYAQAVYTALGNWADGQGFPALTAWAYQAAAEEAEHAKKFIDYVNDRATATLQAVPEPPADFGDYLAALQAALALEQEVSRALGVIYGAAVQANDGATVGLLQWFLAEQVRAEKELSIFIQRVGRGAPLDLLDNAIFEVQP
jgi:ferritin